MFSFRIIWYRAIIDNKLSVSKPTLTYHQPRQIHDSDHPDSKIHGTNMGPIWGLQDPGGPNVGPMNFVIWELLPDLGSDMISISYNSSVRLFVMMVGDIHTPVILKQKFSNLPYSNVQMLGATTLELTQGLILRKQASWPPRVTCWKPIIFLLKRWFIHHCWNGI